MRIQGHQLRGFLAGMGDMEPVCQCITTPCNCAGQIGGAPPMDLNQASEWFKWIAIGIGVLLLLGAFKGK